MDDDYFRPYSLPLPSSGRFSRRRQVTLTLVPGWTVLADAAGAPLPHQEWPAVVDTAMVAALEEAEGFIEDGEERARMVLRLVSGSAADLEGSVLLQGFQVDEFGVLGLTITLLPPAPNGRTMDDEARDQHAEATMLSSQTVQRYLRLARDERTDDVSPELLTALAAEDRPTAVKYAETEARADALLELARNRKPENENDEDEAVEVPDSGEVWLRFLVPLPHSDSRLALTFCAFGDRGMAVPLAEASRLVAGLEPGHG